MRAATTKMNTAWWMTSKTCQIPITTSGRPTSCTQRGMSSLEADSGDIMPHRS